MNFILRANFLFLCNIQHGTYRKWTGFKSLKFNQNTEILKVCFKILSFDGVVWF